VDHAPRAEEEERLEKRVGEDVEDPRGEGPDPDPEEHVAELAHRGVREHLLDVELREPDGRRQQRGRRPHDRDDGERLRREDEEEVHPRRHVDPGGHHRGGVDERRNGGRAGHGVRQPDVERDLRRLPRRAEEEEQPRRGRDRGQQGRVRLHHRVGEERLPRGRGGPSERPEDHEHPDEEAEVADPVHDEGLHPRGGLLRVLVPEADQEVAAEPDPFPADEEHGERVRQHQQDHREHEEVQVGEVPREAAVVGHVADRIDMDEEADPRDEEEHHAGERVEEEPEVDPERARRDPGEEGLGELARPFRPRAQLQEAVHTDGEGEPRGQAGDEVHQRARRPLGAMRAGQREQPVDDRPHQREERDQPQVAGGLRGHGGSIHCSVHPCLVRSQDCALGGHAPLFGSSRARRGRPLPAPRRLPRRAATRSTR